ncbi:mycothiol transferase [Actinoplanes sp. URMC 104]|uniref:mycothiol transferase n=1 Tax=Actinoplanes sp. URMC 104 TaxID=3423409 RepID=UPI003F1A8BF6
MTDFPWEPPMAGTETEHLLGMWERLRATFRWKADGLDAAGLNTRIASSALTIGGLLKHLALVEDITFDVKFGDASPPADPWQRLTSPGAEFTSAADDDPADLYGWYDDAVARSRAAMAAALARGGLDQLAPRALPDGRSPSLRRYACDQIEEYGRHTGHADLLREAIDGRVGEDPPGDWRPASGRFSFRQ